MEDSKMKEALYYKNLKEYIQCELCPKYCKIQEGKVGWCGVRKNIKNKLYSLVYNKPVSMHIDPIEKKPLYHFYPGSKAFSLGTVGCNLGCMHCQNAEISRAKPDDVEIKDVTPKQVIKLAIESKCKIISYTYTEPTVFYEYMLDIDQLAKKENIKNVIVSNGFINEKPLRELCKYIDAANIDLKAFNEEFYKKICFGGLQPVLNSLKILKENDIWLEITNLIIPEENDSPEEIEELSKWIADNLGKDVPLHFSRFYPCYRMLDKQQTPIKTLEQARNIAKKYLNYVYLGNVIIDTNTYCPKCKRLIINRATGEYKKDGVCFCKNKIPGVW